MNSFPEGWGHAGNAGRAARALAFAAVRPRRAAAGQMQIALTAVYDDPVWKDF